MGKRKMHTQTYFQCDWTGLPMRQTNCYMPDWNASGKLLKHGSYVCWEAVIAHAMELNTDKLAQIREHVNELVGAEVQPAPHWRTLAWFSTSISIEAMINSPEEFLWNCQANEKSLTAVCMLADGTTREVMCTKDDVQNKFADKLTRPPNLLGPMHEPQSFKTIRKKSAKDRELTVFYWPFKNGLSFNQAASNTFKMQIYGDVLLVQQSKEACFLPRERYVNYSNSTFLEQFANKGKRKEMNPTFGFEDYAVAKAQMASELQQVEQLASSGASVPGELAKASVIPPPLGKELAELVVAQGRPRPQKKPRLFPPPAVVEVAA